MQPDAIVAKFTGNFSQKWAVLDLLDQKYHAFEYLLPGHFQEPYQALRTVGADMISSDMTKQGVTARGYSANSASLIRHHCPLGGLWEMLPRGRNMVPVSVPLPEAGGGLCQGEICSHSEASTACSLSEHDGKCTSFFSVFTKCKSVKPLMICHLDGKCSPFMGRQVKCRARGCKLFLL